MREWVTTRRGIIAGAIASSAGVVSYSNLESKGTQLTTSGVQRQKFEIMDGKTIYINIDINGGQEAALTRENQDRVDLTGDFDSVPVFSLVHDSSDANIIPPTPVNNVPQTYATGTLSAGEYSLYHTHPDGEEYVITVQTKGIPFYHGSPLTDKAVGDPNNSPKENIRAAISSLPEFSYTINREMVYDIPAQIGIISTQIHDVPKQRKTTIQQGLESTQSKYRRSLAGVGAKRHTKTFDGDLAQFLVDWIWDRTNLSTGTLLHSKFESDVFDMLESPTVSIQSLARKQDHSAFNFQVLIEAYGTVYAGGNVYQGDDTDIGLSFSIPASGSIETNQIGYNVAVENPSIEFNTDSASWEFEKTPPIFE